ncbi:MAG TPA: DUF4912 domain-containing protein [Polyangia bacterium]|nr:DUF4912 domain-containing protein [Polyangia bacterium]
MATRALGALGLSDPAAFLKIGRDGLAKFTHHQLFECSKRLGQKGTSKLSKSALAERIWKELTSLLAPARPEKGASNPAEKAADRAKSPSAKAADKTADSSLEIPEPPPISHKFELGSHGEAEEPRNIPWAYDYDRVTGMAVDPDHLFVYWEVTDQSLERARAGLGASGKNAWLNLRVYDSTGRIFDGTNAHSYFDHGLDRADRQWFFHVGKPSSSAFIDVGLKSHEGYFIKIARSGRIDFPRRETAPFSEPEWLSVRSTWGPVEHAGRGLHGRGAPTAPGPSKAEGGPPPAPPRHVALLPWEESVVLGEGGRAEMVEWEEHFSDGHSEFHRQTSWESPVTISSWEAGPFTHPVEAPEAIRQAFVGPTRVYRVGGRTHVVHGPWQVVIRGLGAHYGHAVVARWEIFKSWIADEVTETHVRDIHPVLPPGASEQLMPGASERRWRYASEARLGGASEIFYLGASEVKARGASERMYIGASQSMMRGASERRLGGASEARLAGASERVLAGASESRLGGASEAHFLGASEARMADAKVKGDGSYPSPDSMDSKPAVKE